MKKLLSLAVLAIPLALVGCDSKSSGTAASKTSSADAKTSIMATHQFDCGAEPESNVNAAAEADITGIYPVKPQATPANVKVLKHNARSAIVHYLVSDTTPDSAKDFVSKAVGSHFLIDCKPYAAGKKV